MPPNPPTNAQRLRLTRDMSSTCAGRLLLVLHNFPVFSLLLSIMPGFNKHVPLFLIKLLCYWCTIKRNVCPLGCICFDPVYCCQWGETRWNYALILFNVYMDDLSIALNSSSIGRERVLS